MPSLFRNRPTRLFFLIALVVFAIYYTTSLIPPSARPYDIWPNTPPTYAGSADPEAGDAVPDFRDKCTPFRLAIAQSTLVVLKTGAVEHAGKLQHWLTTVGACIPRENLLVFSDVEDEVQGVKVRDALRGAPEAAVESIPDFAGYKALREWVSGGRVGDMAEAVGRGGWALDKWKFLPMMRDVHSIQKQQSEGRLQKKWLFFVETDTFVVWENLFTWLEHFDEREKLYMGSPVWPPKQTVFAHGGSGIVLSAEALQKLNEVDVEEEGKVQAWEWQRGMDMGEWCCGDQVLAEVLKRKGIRISGYWPLFNGEPLTTLPFGREHWCEPAITLHHVRDGELDETERWVAGWMASRKEQRPLLFEDLFATISPRLASKTEDWDNKSEDKLLYPPNDVNYRSPSTLLEGAAHASLEDCRAACEDNKQCLQYMFHHNICSLNYKVRLGERRTPEGEGERRGGSWTSGWLMERIEEYKMRHQCYDAHWVRNNP
ncbi:glycosyltransferase family 31 protein [Aulographum hederae CBS 113979]|uniref:N-acetylgalactosaminide beta-1,3-galactosyltransferase n=1 Tax=Aulographum hederae CBS 113979 TaxID=1176131 RepID=A0A6G1GP35_9PEZI|nr:glycosyltransferase family 31 protein [Aulographum hederae CBS 113979]